MAGAEQNLNGAAMLVKPGRLHVRTFIPMKAEPVHCVQNSPSHLFARAFDIRVFDSKNKDTAILSSKKPIKQSGSCTADVQVPRRGGRETNSDGRVVTHRFNFRNAETASRTTSVFGSSVRGRI